MREVRLDERNQVFKLPEPNTLEIEVEIDLQSAGSVHLGIGNGKVQPVTIGFNGLELRVQDAKAPLPRAKGEQKLRLRVFIDRSVLEVFANETVGITKTITPLEATATLEIHTDGGSANAKRIQAWPMNSIW